MEINLKIVYLLSPMFLLDGLFSLASKFSSEFQPSSESESENPAGLYIFNQTFNSETWKSNNGSSLNLPQRRSNQQLANYHPINNRLKAICGKIAVLRHSKGFLEKSEESRPPLKLKNNGGLLSEIFSENHSKCLKMEISLKF